MAKNNHLTKKQARNEIEDTFGFVPDFYDVSPDVIYASTWSIQRDLELSDETVLDHKTKELIGLALAGHIKCQYCSYFHMRAAEAFGASEQELREAVAMGAMTSMFSDTLNGLRYDLEKFQREVDRAVEYIT
jgi:AhpD family alkylhydroperoxidase